MKYIYCPYCNNLIELNLNKSSSDIKIFCCDDCLIAICYQKNYESYDISWKEKWRSLQTIINDKFYKLYIFYQNHACIYYYPTAENLTALNKNLKGNSTSECLSSFDTNLDYFTPQNINQKIRTILLFQ